MRTCTVRNRCRLSVRNRFEIVRSIDESMRLALSMDACQSRMLQFQLVRERGISVLPTRWNCRLPGPEIPSVGYSEVFFLLFFAFFLLFYLLYLSLSPSFSMPVCSLLSRSRRGSPIFTSGIPWTRDSRTKAFALYDDHGFVPAFSSNYRQSCNIKSSPSLPLHSVFFVSIIKVLCV